MIHLSLIPVDGDPEAVRDLASRLTSGAAGLTDINTALAGIKAGANWDSPAGQKFEGLVQASPPLIDGLVHRYAMAAEALRTFAVDLETAQLQDQTARNRLGEAVTEDRLLDLLAATHAGNPEMTAQIEKRQREVADRVFEIQALHESATNDFAEADLRLSRRFWTLADDTLEDSWHYRAVAMVDETAASITEGVSSLGEIVPLGDVLFGALPGGSHLMTATAGATALSGALLRTVYGEGEWKTVGVNSLGVLKAGGKTMKSAGMTGASNPASNLATRRRVYAGKSVSTGSRLRQGTRDRLHESNPALAKILGVKAPHERMKVVSVPPTLAPLKGQKMRVKARRLAEFGKAKAVHAADEKYLNDFRAAAAGGDNAKRLFVAGAVVEGSATKVKKAAEDALVAKPEEKAAAPTYP